MKVVLLTAHLSDAAGGLSKSVPGLANSLLSNNGVSVRVIGVHDKTAPDDWVKWGKCVDRCREVGPHSFGWAPFLPRALAEYSPDVVDVQGLWMYPSLACLRWHCSTSKPHVVTPRGMLDPWAVRRMTWKKRIVGWCFEYQHLRRAACLRATSTMEADHFRVFGLSNPIAIVPNGIELPMLEPRRAKKGRLNRLLFLSRLHPKKGLDFLLRAWSELQRKHVDWELVIAGPDEIGHGSKMRILAEQLAIERVRWFGPVYGKQKFELYRSADLFVLPTHAENFGLVVGEALAHELPVITTKNAPWQGLEEHQCGWWVGLDDRILRSTLEEAMGLSEAERLEMGSRGRAWVQLEFAWPAIGRQMVEVYKWLLGGGSAPSCVMDA